MGLLLPLLAQRARRDRLQLALWIVGTAGLALMATAAVGSTFGDETEREAILRLTIVAPAILIFRGTPNGAGEGEFAVFLILAFLALLAGLMSTFLAVRHTRGDEEQSRAELVAATPAARTLPTVATVVHGVLANLLLAIAVAGAFMASGLDASGSAVAGIAVGATGVAFLAIGLVAAQLFRTSRSANALSVSLVLAAYLVRGLGDALGEASDDGLVRTAAWPSWLSPIGWAQRTEPFAANDLAPLLLSVGLAAVLIGLVFMFQSARDSGASLLPGRAGRATAGPMLRGNVGLAWRLNVGAIASWAVGAVLAGALATTLTPLVDQIGTDAPAIADTLRQVAGPSASLEEAFTVTFFSMVGILAAAAALQAVMRARQEEAHGSAEPVLAAPVPRRAWLGGYALVGALAIVLILVLAAGGALLGSLAADDPAASAENALKSALAQAPAALVFLGLGLLVFVLAPRLTIPVGWALLAAGAFFGIFGEILGLPDWVHDLSPFAHAPLPVGGEVDWTGGFWMLGVSAAAVALAVAAMGRRELTTDG
ncbi:ABC transporter permease [Agromyces kandeliae]|uniref:Polyketide antibiotic transporter n=1 Tax=Agromyces kandeliae TaxID=2666141 RepID=A0A6L5R0N5_9MICO|nr:polyketide antibiotic transporter [Agromyces kandeliae]MRX43144.1 polyketide antibiotic transporter [Agromyces kandeliae]